MKSTEEPEVGYYQNYGSIEPALATIRPEINEELSKRYGSESLIKDPTLQHLYTFAMETTNILILSRPLTILRMAGPA